MNMYLELNKNITILLNVYSKQQVRIPAQQIMPLPADQSTLALDNIKKRTISWFQQKQQKLMHHCEHNHTQANA